MIGWSLVRCAAFDMRASNCDRGAAPAYANLQVA